MKENFPVDFVLLWVDGNDPAWQKEFTQYYKNDRGVDASFARVRCWDNLQYLFRGIEKFAPWMRTLHFVTWGHLPPWLNTAAPKLHVVKHSDFVPKQYLPTFSNFPTALNLHRIDGLAEHFVAFDDDMFLGRCLASKRFFNSGLPCDIAQLCMVKPTLPFAHYLISCLHEVHKRHNLRQIMLHNPGKWFNPKYGAAALLKNMWLFPYANMSGFRNPHVPVPYLRSTFEKLWQEEFAVLDATSHSRFRNHADLEWLMRYEQLATGQFHPVGVADTHNDTISDANAAHIARYIADQRYAMFCINDSNEIADFEKAKNTINAGFERILSGKSSFEL
jgi:hypothetical protein